MEKGKRGRKMADKTAGTGKRMITAVLAVILAIYTCIKQPVDERRMDMDCEYISELRTQRNGGISGPSRLRRRDTP